MTPPAISQWKLVVETRDWALLRRLLADDVVFSSPIVHTPKIGRDAVLPFLKAAIEVLGGPDARYVNDWVGPSSAVLELETRIGDISVNVVDIISWNAAGEITGFKVMARPLKAINALQEAMVRQLSA